MLKLVFAYKQTGGVTDKQTCERIYAQIYGCSDINRVTDKQTWQRIYAQIYGCSEINRVTDKQTWQRIYTQIYGCSDINRVTDKQTWQIIYAQIYGCSDINRVTDKQTWQRIYAQIYGCSDIKRKYCTEWKSYITLYHIMTTLKKKTFEHMGKVENVVTSIFYFFPRCFLLYQRKTHQMSDSESIACICCVLGHGKFCCMVEIITIYT